MKASTTDPSRSRAEILAEIANLPPAVHGKLCSYRNVRKNGSVKIYHNLQYWHNGKNHSKFIPEGKVDAIKEALATGAKLKELLIELSTCDVATVLDDNNTLKKRSCRKPPRG